MKRGTVKRSIKRMKAEVSSGNVFADLGLPDADELNTKVRLAVQINRLIESRSLSQTAASRLLEVNQPKISALKNYKLEGFSVERLMNFLLALGQDVEIRIKPHRKGRAVGRIWVQAA